VARLDRDLPTQPPAYAEPADTPAGISDTAVRAGTGKGWAEWFALLDAASGPQIGHQGIAAVLAEHHRVGTWWRQLVAVAYEQERGMRQRHRIPEGFQLSVSQTVDVPADDLFRAWADQGARARWLPHAEFTIRKATPPSAMRIAWGDGSAVDVSVYPRGNTRSRVVVDHKRLRDAHRVRLMKEFWAAALEALKLEMEGG